MNALSLDPADCVARGVALLDQRNEDWADEIDLSRLSMGSAYACVVAQLHGDDYEHGLVVLFPDAEDEDRYRLTCEHGFDIFGGNYRELNRLWYDAITDRTE